MELKDEDPPPFWLQSSNALHHADLHRRRRYQAASSLFLNTGVLVVFLLAAAVMFLAIVIPSVMSLARQVFNPSLVKSSWNSLNLVLVIFAIVCGFLGRKDENDQTPVSSPMRRGSGKYVETSPRQGYGFQDSRMVYNNSFGSVDGMRRLRRNGGSYPDLRQEGPWMVTENRWRSYDDTHVYRNHQFERSESRLSRSKSMGGSDDDDEIVAKNIEVDTFASVVKDARPRPTTPPSLRPSPPPSPPPPAARKHFRSRDIKDEGQCHIKNIEMDASESDQPKVLKSESNPPASVRQPAPRPSSPPAYSQQTLSPLSPVSPTTYFWPPPSPPPPPPPPPPRARSSAIAKNKRNNNQIKRESGSKVETEMLPSPPEILSHPWTPPSPLSPTNYFWPPPSPPPPPPPPPPPMRTHPTIITKKKHESKRNTPPKRESRSKIEVPPPPPPPPPPATPPRSRTKIGKSSEDTGDKKGGIVIRTLGRLPRRKRRHTRRSYENLEEFIEPPKVSIHRSKSTPEFPPTSPPRPPSPPASPPPQHSIFQNIFSKKGKSAKKKPHYISSAPPHPPPPPEKPLYRTKIAPPSTRKPVPPAKINSFSSIDENIIGNGSESPLIRIPPPPPPPPFKMPSWKYVMQGDYVKIESSSNSPRSGYSASEDEDSSSSNQKTSEASPPPLFWQSPDVNTKADDFIARFRAKLTLEKMNSIKLNQGTRPSPLGPVSDRS